MQFWLRIKTTPCIQSIFTLSEVTCIEIPSFGIGVKAGTLTSPESRISWDEDETVKIGMGGMGFGACPGRLGVYNGTFTSTAWRNRLPSEVTLTIFSGDTSTLVLADQVAFGDNVTVVQGSFVKF